VELVGIAPELNLYDEEWPILTYQRQSASAKFVFQGNEREGKALDSIVSGGCIVSGALVNRSLLFSQVKLHSHALVEDSVVLPEVDIGRYCRVKRALLAMIPHYPTGSWRVTVQSPSSNRLSRNGREAGRGVKKGGGTERLPGEAPLHTDQP
jgi:glucose-1-phosphate adenylyltransferase